MGTWLINIVFMGACKSKFGGKKAVNDFENDDFLAFDGGDDDDEPKSGCCSCNLFSWCGGGAGLLEHEEADVEHDPDNVKDISEFTEEEFQAINWARNGSSPGEIGTNTGNHGDDRQPVNLD